MHDPKTCIRDRYYSGWGYNHPIGHSPSSPLHIYPRSHICRRQTFSESLVSSVTVALPAKVRAHYFFSPARRPADDSNSQTHPSSYEQESDEILAFVVVFFYGVFNSIIPNCTMRLYSHSYDTASSHCRENFLKRSDTEQPQFILPRKCDVLSCTATVQFASRFICTKWALRLHVGGQRRIGRTCLRYS